MNLEVKDIIFLFLIIDLSLFFWMVSKYLFYIEKFLNTANKEETRKLWHPATEKPSKLEVISDATFSAMLYTGRFRRHLNKESTARIALEKARFFLLMQTPFGILAFLLPFVNKWASL